MQQRYKILTPSFFPPDLTSLILFQFFLSPLWKKSVNRIGTDDSDSDYELSFKNNRPSIQNDEI